MSGPDAGDFTIDPATGSLCFTATPDFEAPADNDQDNVCVLVVEATAGNGNTSQQTVTVIVADLTEDTTPPEVAGSSGNGPSQAKMVTAGEPTVAIFTTIEVVTWSVEGGADTDDFAIDPLTGELRFVAPPNFDDPADTDGDNVYLVTILATDADGNRTELAVAVTVVDTGAPQITGPSGGAGAAGSAIIVDEETTTLAIFRANDAVT